MTTTADVRRDLEFWVNLLDNAFKLWFTPEIERQLASGVLQKPVKIWGAQVILQPGRPPAIYFNDSLQGVFAARFKGPTYRPENGMFSDLSQIKSIDGITLTEAHPDAGHLTVVYYEPFPFIAFDFRYNATRITALINRATEFHAAARSALRKQHYVAFAENLFAEMELLAKALLATSPDERALTVASHRFIKTELNRHTKRGNVPERFVQLHNSLTGMRVTARYGVRPFSLPQAKATAMLRLARAFAKYVDARRPRRWKDAGG